MRILYFSPINWGDLKQRPQHIAEELAQHHVVTFIEPSISFLTSILKKNRSHKQRKFNINNNLNVLRPSGQWRLPKSVGVIDVLGINHLSEKKQLRDLINRSDLIWLGSPIFYPLVSHVKGKTIIYDKMDDYEHLTTNKFIKKMIRIWERKLIQTANKIFVSSLYLYTELLKYNEKVYLIRNAVDDISLNNYVDSEVSLQIEQLKRSGKIVFGYVGAIDHWFDYDVVKEILKFNDHFVVVIVGRDNLPHKRVVSPNVRYYNPVSKTEVFGVIKACDYCLYPFKIDLFINTINPVKIYEYLSCNKKVIAARSDEILMNKEKLLIYSSKHELRNILQNLSEIKSPFPNDELLMEYVEDNTWRKRTEDMLNVIEIR